ncbi:MAG: hypothetical protein RIT81_16395 [Deltaproteobacteria bacterium]
MKAEALARAIENGLGVEVVPIPLANATALEGVDRLRLTSCAVEPPVDQYLLEDYDFVARGQLIMTLDKADLGKAQDQLVDVVRIVADLTSGDLLLVRESESVALRRHAGRFDVVLSDPLWREPSRVEPFR